MPRSGDNPVFAVRSEKQNLAMAYASAHPLERTLLRYDDDGIMLYPTYHPIEHITQGKFIEIKAGTLSGDIYRRPEVTHALEFRINRSHDIHKAIRAMDHITLGMMSTNTLAHSIGLRAEALLDLFQANYLSLTPEDFSHLRQSTSSMLRSIGVDPDHHIGGQLGEAIDFLIKGSTGRDRKKPNPLIAEIALAAAYHRALEKAHPDEHIDKFFRMGAALRREQLTSKNIVGQLTELCAPESDYALSILPTTDKRDKLPTGDMIGRANTVTDFWLPLLKLKPYRTLAKQMIPVAKRLQELVVAGNWRTIQAEQLLPRMFELVLSLEESPQQTDSQAA